MSEVPTFKVILLGDLGVGKTCIRSQFVHHIFTNAYKATIGGDYLTTTVSISHQSFTAPSINDGVSDKSVNDIRKVNLQIWDTAGQERFNSISRAFYRGADIVILVYDITNYESLLNLKTWFKNFIDNCQVRNPGVIIVGNKVDKANERVCDIEEIHEILTLNINSGNDSNVDLNNYVNWDNDLFEICCKKIDSVDKVFYRVGQLALELQEDKTAKSDLISFENFPIESSNKCFC